VPITLTRDDEPRRFTAVGDGDVNMSELLELLATYRTGDYRDYSMLLDIRTANLQLTVDEFKAITAKSEALDAGGNARGAVGVVASAGVVYGLARMYETLVELRNRAPLKVFRTVPDALAWLATREHR
jgi:hypothetical protein